jgi:hypothetical protein
MDPLLALDVHGYRGRYGLPLAPIARALCVKIKANWTEWETTTDQLWLQQDHFIDQHG